MSIAPELKLVLIIAFAPLAYWQRVRVDVCPHISIEMLDASVGESMASGGRPTAAKSAPLPPPELPAEDGRVDSTADGAHIPVKEEHVPTKSLCELLGVKRVSGPMPPPPALVSASAGAPEPAAVVAKARKRGGPSAKAAKAAEPKAAKAPRPKAVPKSAGARLPEGQHVDAQAADNTLLAPPPLAAIAAPANVSSQLLIARAMAPHSVAGLSEEIQSLSSKTLAQRDAAAENDALGKWETGAGFFVKHGSAEAKALQALVQGTGSQLPLSLSQSELDDKREGRGDVVAAMTPTRQRRMASESPGRSSIDGQSLCGSPRSGSGEVDSLLASLTNVDERSPHGSVKRQRKTQDEMTAEEKARSRDNAFRYKWKSCPEDLKQTFNKMKALGDEDKMEEFKEMSLRMKKDPWGQEYFSRIREE